MRISKFIFFSVVLLLLTANSFAQRLDIKWSAPIKRDKKYYFNFFYGDQRNGYTAFFTSSRGKAYVLGLTPDLNPNFEKEIGVPVPEGLSDKDKFSLYAVHYLHGLAYVFVSYYNKSQDNKYLFYFNINSDGVVQNNLTEVSRIEDVGKHEGGFSIRVSEDSSKVLIYTVGPSKSRDQVAYNVQVYDDRMHKLWGRDIQLDYLIKDLSYDHFAIDDDGDVAFGGFVRLHGEDKKDKSRYKAFLNVWFGKTNEIKNYDIELPGLYIENMGYVFDNYNKRIVITGFYSEKSNRSYSFNGYYYISIDRDTKQVLTHVTAEVPPDILKSVKKGFNLIYAARLLTLDQDGRLIASFEPNEVVTTRDSKGHTYTTYYSLSILVYAIKPDGKLLWMDVVAKYQVGGSNLCFSHMTIQDGNTLHLIYNDNLKNIGITDATGAKKLRSYHGLEKSTMVVDAYIDCSTGVVQKSNITQFNEKHKPIVINPEFNYRLNYNTYAMLSGVFSKEYYISLINLPNAVKPKKSAAVVSNSTPASTTTVVKPTAPASTPAAAKAKAPASTTNVAKAKTPAPASTTSAKAPAAPASTPAPAPMAASPASTTAVAIDTVKTKTTDTTAVKTTPVKKTTKKAPNGWPVKPPNQP